MTISMVLDASVIMKVLIPEPYSEVASQLLSQPGAWSPDIMGAEIGHALTKMVRARVLTSPSARRGLEQLTVLPLRWFASESVRLEALDLSIHLNATYYDCIYLAWALSTNDELVTADANFVNTVRSRSDTSRFVRALSEV